MRFKESSVLQAVGNDLEFLSQPGRSTVGLQPLELRIGVRIPAGLPSWITRLLLFCRNHPSQLRFLVWKRTRGVTESDQFSKGEVLIRERFVRLGLDDGEYITRNDTLNDETTVFDSHDPILLIED